MDCGEGTWGQFVRFWGTAGALQKVHACTLAPLESGTAEIQELARHYIIAWTQ